MRNRTGYNLLEILVVLAIIAILLGILLPAVQVIRGRGLRLQDENNLKQIMLGLHNYASVAQGQLPYRFHSIVYSNGDYSPFRNVLPFIDSGLQYPYYKLDSFNMVRYFEVKLFLSPTDPTLVLPINTSEIQMGSGRTSYAANQQVFIKSSNLGSTFVDGTSATIGFSQHYHICPNAPNSRTGANHYFSFRYPYGEPADPSTPDLPFGRSGSFADPLWRDVVPMTGANYVTKPSVPGVTFQLAPKIEKADGNQLQATQKYGLLVVMFDGSVRTLAPTIAPNIFWAFVTPAANDSISE